MAATKIARFVAAGLTAAAIAVTSLGSGATVSAASSATNFNDDKEHAVSVFDQPAVASVAVIPVQGSPVFAAPLPYAYPIAGQIDNSGDR